MPLRPYQLACIEAVRESVRALRAAGKPLRVCVVMPTGAGKTRTHAEIARSAIAKGGSVLWLAHRAELVDQAVGALRDEGLTVGAISASAASAPQPHARVQVATVQTLISRRLRPPATLIIADEAHHYVAKTFGAVVGDYPQAVVLGPTATPERSDGKGLGGMFEALVVGARIKQLIELGHLVPASLIRPHRKLRSGEIAQRPVDAYLQHARGKRAIVFSPSVLVAEEHAAQFRALGVPAKMVEGNTDASERRAAFAALRSGAVPVLTNVYIATEGFDIPAIECVILARGCGHAGTYLQMVGRGLRPSAGKDECVVLDLGGISHDHGHPEDDRVYSLTGRGISEPGEASGVVQRYCRVCTEALDPDATVCPTCGTECAGPPQVVTGDKLEKYAAKRREAPDARAATLARWIKDGVAKGYKPGWARAKYRAVYGEPPAEVEAMAHALLRPEPAAEAQVEEWT